MSFAVILLKNSMTLEVVFWNRLRLQLRRNFEIGL